MKQQALALVLIIIGAFVLRVAAAHVVPPAPYWEEVALGYDAYSLLKTGMDHHGNPWPILALESFGDWKPSGYVYATIPSIALFGLSVWAVRLPSMLAGVALVAGVAVLVQQVFSTTKKSDQQWVVHWSLAAALITAISPWALILSRSAWETNLATALTLWGSICVLKAFSSKSSNLLYSFVAGILIVYAAYTYHATRVSAPMVLGIAILFSWMQSGQQVLVWVRVWYRQLVVLGVLVLFGLLPLFISILQGSSVGHRISETSIFADSAIIEESNRLRESQHYSFVSRIVYHRYLLFGMRMVQNAVSHLSPTFLFTNGDSNIRHSTGFGGQLYLIDAVFLLVGLISVWKRERKVFWFLLAWISVAILPASITMATPHALRAALELPALLIFIGSGCAAVIGSVERIKTGAGKVVMGLIAAVYATSFTFFWNHYTTVYPVTAAREWQYGYQQAIEQLGQAQALYPNYPVYITREQGRPAMYYWFFNKTSPQLVQSEDVLALKDQGEYLSFQNVRFVRGAYEVDSQNALLLASPQFADELRSAKESLYITELSVVSALGPAATPVWGVYVIAKK